MIHTFARLNTAFQSFKEKIRGTHPIINLLPFMMLLYHTAILNNMKKHLKHERKITQFGPTKPVPPPNRQSTSKIHLKKHSMPAKLTFFQQYQQ